MSTKTEKLSGQLKNPFSTNLNTYSALSNSYQNYSLGVESNVQALRRRFPQQSGKKLRELLEEMEGNLEMAIGVLEEEYGREAVIIPEKPCCKKISEEEQNRLLKKAVAQLYKKLRETEKESESLKESN